LLGFVFFFFLFVFKPARNQKTNFRTRQPTFPLEFGLCKTSTHTVPWTD